ncbi:MAG: transcriptional repressor [Verrucomicrobiales bacterium]|nr:transcriptional repressor [Verrucomicrobiales bacterium]
MANNKTVSEKNPLGDLRMTKQRKVVYDVLVEGAKDHPTASEVFVRAKELMPSISLATVYNCLETMTQAGVVTQVNMDREASRFCPNLQPHAHFFCSECEEIFDVGLKEKEAPTTPWALPDGMEIDQLLVNMRGVCPKCAAKNSNN